MSSKRLNQILKEAEEIATRFSPYSPHSADNAVASLLELIKELVEDQK